MLCNQRLLTPFFFFSLFIPIFGVSASNEVGIQTDTVGESDVSRTKNDLLFVQQHQNKLLDIWNSSNGKKFGRELVLKLFSACEVDLQVLFGHLNTRNPLKTKVDTKRMANEPLVGLPESAVAAKVSHLYLILTKVYRNLFLKNTMALLDDYHFIKLFCIMMIFELVTSNLVRAFC